MFIARGLPTTNQDLAEHLGGLPSAMSRITDSLVQGGYVTRKSDGADRRRVNLCLTPRGKARIELSAEVHQGEVVAARYLGSFAVYREA